MNEISRVADYLRSLQGRIIAELEQLDGKETFLRDTWDRPGGGGGESRVLKRGRVFEQAGVNFSHVFGKELPPSATSAATGPRRSGLPGHGDVSRPASAKPLCADNTCKLSLLHRRRRRQRSRVVVRRWFRPDTVLSLPRGCHRMAPGSERCLRSLRRQCIRRLQKVVRRVLLSQTPR